MTFMLGDLVMFGQGYLLCRDFDRLALRRPLYHGADYATSVGIVLGRSLDSGRECLVVDLGGQTVSVVDPAENVTVLVGVGTDR